MWYGDIAAAVLNAHSVRNSSVFDEFGERKFFSNNFILKMEWKFDEHRIKTNVERNRESKKQGKWPTEKKLPENINSRCSSRHEI